MTGSTFHVIGYAKAGKEFEVRDAIQALGITASVPRKVEAKRVGKKRFAEAIIEPYLGNYIFIECDAEQWHQLPDVKHMARTTVFVSRGEAKHLRTFIEGIESDYAKRMASIEAGHKVQEYQPGDEVLITDGPLAGRLAKFKRIVETSRDPFPRLKVQGEMMGQEVTMDVDPIHARRAG